MKTTPPFDFLVPWSTIPEHKKSNFESELSKELRPDHHLFGSHCAAVALRQDCDDVLFQTDSDKGCLVIVHLTWIGKPDQYPDWPSTRFFDSWEDFQIREMIPENENWN